MDLAHVPGLVITVVEGDEVLLSKGYGYADLENRIPMTPQTNVRAGSVSKPVLSTAVIRLVEQGLLDLDAPVSEYIIDLDLEDEHGSASTVGQLLNHEGQRVSASGIEEKSGMSPINESVWSGVGPYIWGERAGPYW